MKKNAPAQSPRKTPAPSAAASKNAATSAAETPNHWLWLGLCLLATLLVYIPAFSATFVNWDDADYGPEQMLIRSFSPISKFFTTSIQGNMHPLTMLSLAFNYAIGGDNPASYHILNVLLHLANTALAYWLAWRLSGGKFWVALLTGLLFGIHPMHVESVAWVSERKDVLYTLFYLSALLGYLRFLEKPGMGAYLGFTALYACSLLSKPAAVTFPIALFLIDFYRNRPLTMKTALEKAPHFLLALGLGYLTLHYQSSVGATDSKDLFPASRTMFFGFYSFAVYWLKVFLPTNLACFHAFPAANNALPMTYTLAPIFAAGLAVVLFLTRKQSRLPLFAVGFFALNLALVLQFFVVGSAIYSDRYAYLPYWSAFFLLGWALQYLVETRRSLSSGAAFALVGAVAAIFGYMAHRHAQTWQTPEKMWDNAIAVDPSARAYSLRAVLHRKAGESDKAFDLAAIALKMHRRDEDALLVQSNVYLERNNLEKAIEGYNTLIEWNPTNAAALTSRGAAFGKQGKWPEALADLEKALTLKPDDSKALLNAGIAYGQLGQHQKSLATFQHYLVVKPNDGDVINSVGYEHEILGDLPKAIENYSKAIEIIPKQGVFWMNRARAKLLSGDKTGARADAEKAQSLGTQLNPELLQRLK